MGIFSNKANSLSLELYKQKAHLSNDYLQALSPLIESITSNEGERHSISNQLFELIEEMKNSLSPEIFIKVVGFMEVFVKHSEATAENYNRLIQYYTDMGQRTTALVDEYGSMAK